MTVETLEQVMEEVKPRAIAWLETDPSVKHYGPGTVTDFFQVAVRAVLDADPALFLRFCSAQPQGAP